MKNYISRITPSIGTDCIYLFIAFRGFPGGSEGKASACNVGVLGLIPGLGRSPGEIAWHSSTLAWKIPRIEKPGRLQSMGSQRVGHN